MGSRTRGAEGPMDLLADTKFLIDLWREARAPGPATAYANVHLSSDCDFLGRCRRISLRRPGRRTGFELARAFLARYPVLHSDAATVRFRCHLRRPARAQRLIGPNDLWIAASALANDFLFSREIPPTSATSKDLT